MTLKRISKKWNNQNFMAQAKRTVKKEKAPERYYSALGRRKSSVVRVRLFPTKDETPPADNVMVNDKKLKIFFPLAELQEIVVSPLAVAGGEVKFRVLAFARGGGIRGQAEAARLAVARALVKFNEKLRQSLRAAGYLTRDDRAVERKKAGLKKARRAPQWKKR